MISIRSIFWAGCVWLAFVASFAGWAVLTMPDPDKIVSSTVVTDREGKVLRAFLTSAGAWRFRADLDNIDPTFIDALLLIEDKRFAEHFGVDLFDVLGPFCIR